jgi:hypothetical protein
MRIGHSTFSAGGNMHIRLDPTMSPGLSAPSWNTLTNDNTDLHINCFGAWHVKEQFSLGGGIFKTGEGRSFVKRTVNVVIERSDPIIQKDHQSDPRSPRSNSKNGSAANCLEAAYGMQVRVNDICGKVSNMYNRLCPPQSVNCFKIFQKTPDVSCVHRQQIFCWIATPGTKAKVRGILVLTSVSA